MKYKIGQEVVLKSNPKISKFIVDMETILDVDIYYMSDNTSFSCNQIEIKSDNPCHISKPTSEEICKNIISFFSQGPLNFALKFPDGKYYKADIDGKLYEVDPPSS